jgi:predicted RNA polymerase sigma factor
MNGSAAEARVVAETVARRSHGKLVAYLTAQTRDVTQAEDALAEAFAIALAEWPDKGCPANPEAWLLTVARRRALDGVRKRRNGQIASQSLLVLAEGREAERDADIPDHRLALMFAATHPAIDKGLRAPLMLQVVLGLKAETIASAFLTSPAAMSKRLVRAKEKIGQAGIPFAVPEREELAERLEAVLDAIYAAFAEGWSDPEGADLARRDLTEEGLYLARLVAHLLPDEPEGSGLLALMLHAEARRKARRDAGGRYVPLAEHDIALWDWQMIEEAEGLLARAGTMVRIGRYQLEGALQSALVHRRRSGANNWADVVRIYDGLHALTGSPVVLINRALALAERDGAAAGLEANCWCAAALSVTHGTPMRWPSGLERDAAVREFLQGRWRGWDYNSTLPASGINNECIPPSDYGFKIIHPYG